MSSRLEELGWNPVVAEAFAPLAAAGKIPGRVTIPHRGVCWVFVEEGEMEATVAGRIRRAPEGPIALPAAGDWVAMTPPTGSGRARIDAVLPRYSQFVRKAPGRNQGAQVVAANVDTAFVITAVGRDLNLRRLERYLALAWESGAQPVVVVTKADLDETPDATTTAVASAAVGVPIHRVSGKTLDNLEALRPYLGHGHTVAFVGSSGVGKSTLINALLGEERQKVAEVGVWGKGRHTTTQRELIRMPGGGLLLDTPGMRELQIWDAAEGIEETFGDIDALAEGCRFGDCRHDAEPGCAVTAAVQAGVLDAARLDSFRKLSAEQRFQEGRLDRAAQAETKRVARAMNKALRSHLDRKYERK